MIAYIAAPLSAPTEPERRANLDRARAFRDVIQTEGYACYLPHDGIGARYGYPERDETADERLRALAECYAMLDKVCRAGGSLFVLLRGDGSLSGGCAAEVEHVRECWPRTRVEMRAG